MRKYIVYLMMFSLILLTGFTTNLPVQAGNNSGKAVALPEEDVVLNQMEAVGRKMNTLVAKLSQQKINTQLGIKDEEFGELHYVPAKNGAMKLRIDITQPAKRTIIINGDEVKYYDHETHQLLITSLKNKPKTKSFGSLAITFGSVAAIRANYNVSYLKDEKIGSENAALLKLIPKEPGQYKEINIWISRSMGLPVQQRFVEKNNDVLIMSLSGLKLNEQFNIKSLIDNFKPADAKIVRD